MQIKVRDESPFKTIFMSIKLYRICKKCFRDTPENYKLKAIKLYCGEMEREALDEEFSVEVENSNE